MNVPQLELAPQSLIYAVPAAVVLFLTAAILIRERGSAASRAYGVFSIATLVWLAGSIAVYTSVDATGLVPLAQIVLAASTLIGPAIYHFAVLVAERPPSSGLRLTLAWLTGLGFSALHLFTELFIDGIHAYSWGHYPALSAAAPLWCLYEALLIGATLRLFWRGSRDPRNGPNQRERHRMLFIALCLAAITFVDVLAAFGIPLPPTAPLVMPLYLAFVTYTAWRYRLLEITPAFAASRVLQTMSEALLVVDGDGVVRLANPAAHRLFETAPEGQSLASVLDDPSLLHKLQARLGERSSGPIQLPYRPRCGPPRTLWLSAAPLGPGSLGAKVCVFNDITALRTIESERNRLTRKLEHTLAALADANGRMRDNSIRDPISGAFSRRHLEDSLAGMWLTASRQNYPLSVVLLRIDAGIDAAVERGDRQACDLLREVAVVLQEAACAPGQLVARFNRSEFAVILPGADSIAARDFTARARRMIGALNFPHMGAGARLTACFGSATADPGSSASTPYDLLHEAAVALTLSAAPLPAQASAN